MEELQVGDTLFMFDGRVLEVFVAKYESKRYHVTQLDEAKVSAPDKHGWSNFALRRASPADPGFGHDIQAPPEALAGLQDLFERVLALRSSTASG